jgi:thioredoxin-like negative regulator of GroEL
VDPILLRLVLVGTVLVAAAVAGRVWTARDGRVRLVAEDDDQSTPRLSSAELESVGLVARPAGPQALLLGSPTCAPCVTVRRVLDEVRAERPDLRWAYVDAADHLDLANAHGVRRVPTLLVLDVDGRIVARTSGVPRTSDLVAALDGRGELTAAA